MSSKRKNHKVVIIMGSQSDYATMQYCQKVLKILKIKHEIKIISAHRTPERMYKFAKTAEKNNISVNFLQDAKSWVWIPHNVEFSGSTDGVNYQRLKSEKKKTDEHDFEKIIETFSATVENNQFQFIRITTQSFIQCPEWHLGAGGKAWIFADEIIIK